MTRTARATGDSGINHVMLRGINRQRIFEDDEDRDRFLEILKKSKEKDGFDLLAWCLMPNHVHLLIHENEVKFMELNAQAVEEKCMDMVEQPRKHLTVSRAWELIRRSSGCETTAEFQRLEKVKRDEVLRKVLKEGVSIRQASRLTGISIGVISRFVNG